MDLKVIYERDILYPTSCAGNPGSIHIQVCEPDRAKRIPVVIEAVTEHSPLENIDSILQIIRSEIFNRLSIDTTKNADIYIKATPVVKVECSAHSHIKLKLTGQDIEYEGVDL